MTTTVEVHEAQERLASLLEAVRSGDEIIIVRDGSPLARLTGLATPAPPDRERIAGLHQGAAWVSDDFDEPLPDEFWTGAP